MNCKIICIGNRLVEADAAALWVFDELQQRVLPDNISLLEGGLMGLNLLPYFECGGRIVLVDSVAGFAKNSSIVVLKQEDIIAAGAKYYDHDAGLAYLLSVLPKVCTGELPDEILLIGIEGNYTKQLVLAAADLAESISRYGVNL